MSLHELLAMGDYGVYVWSAYGLTLLVFGIQLVKCYQEKNRIRKVIQEYLLQSSQAT